MALDLILEGARLQRYELWRSADGCELAFFAADSDINRRQLGPGFVLAWTCEASSWTEAQQMKHAHLGWEPYKPMPEATL